MTTTLTTSVSLQVDGKALARTVQEHMLRKAAPPQWPGWWRDEQLAAEAAQEMARALAAAVSPQLLAAGWLAIQPPAGPPTQRQPQTIQQQQREQREQRERQQRRQMYQAARRYLLEAGVAAALASALLALLRGLYELAWRLGRESVAQVLGSGELAPAWAALDRLLTEGAARADGIVATRISRLERALEEALRTGASAGTLAAQITAILGSYASALAVTQTEVTWASSAAALGAYSGAGVAMVRWQTENDSRVCAICKANQAAGAREIGKRFPSGQRWPPAHTRCRCSLMPAPAVQKSPQTPVLSTVHNPLGHEGLWHTPDRHVAYMQQLPAYIQSIARALLRDHSMSEGQAIATAINAVKRWARGDLHWGDRRIHPEVVAAARRALAEWESLRASHK